MRWFPPWLRGWSSTKMPSASRTPLLTTTSSTSWTVFTPVASPYGCSSTSTVSKPLIGYHITLDVNQATVLAWTNTAEPPVILELKLQHPSGPRWCNNCFSFLLCDAALVLRGNINPAHPNTIGCIDSMCYVTEVTRGKKTQVIFLEWVVIGLKSAGGTLISVFSHLSIIH